MSTLCIFEPIYNNLLQTAQFIPFLLAHTNTLNQAGDILINLFLEPESNRITRQFFERKNFEYIWIAFLVSHILRLNFLLRFSDSTAQHIDAINSIKSIVSLVRSLYLFVCEWVTFDKWQKMEKKLFIAFQRTPGHFFLKKNNDHMLL